MPAEAVCDSYWISLRCGWVKKRAEEAFRFWHWRSRLVFCGAMRKVLERSEWSPIVIFGAAYLVVMYAVALYWHSRGYFDIRNLFFDADPDTNLTTFSHGWGRRALSHPLLELVSVPVRVLGWVVFQVGLVSSVVKLREVLALSVSPVFSAATLVAFYGVLRTVHVGRIDAYLFTLLFALAFSNLIFAVLPETFAISGLLVTLLVGYYLRCREKGSPGSDVVWSLLGIAMAGVTVTNAAIFAIVYALHLTRSRGLPVWRALLGAGVYGAGVAAFVVVVCVVVYALLDVRMGSEGRLEWIVRFLTKSGAEAVANLLNLFSASVNAFVAVGVETASYREGCDAGGFCSRLTFVREVDDLIMVAWAVAPFAAVAALSARGGGSVGGSCMWLVSRSCSSISLSTPSSGGRCSSTRSTGWPL